MSDDLNAQSAAAVGFDGFLRLTTTGGEQFVVNAKFLTVVYPAPYGADVYLEGNPIPYQIREIPETVFETIKKRS